MSSECFVYFRIAWPNFVSFLGTKTVASDRGSWNEWNGLWKPTEKVQLFVIRERVITYARQHTRRTIQSHPVRVSSAFPFGFDRWGDCVGLVSSSTHAARCQSEAPFLFHILATATLQITRVLLRLRACCVTAPRMCMRGIVAALIKWWQNTAVASGKTTEFVCLSTIVIDESGHACIC